jgi:mRNA interferase HicA
VRGNKFIQKVRALGRRRGVPTRIDEKRGKGSHIMLYYGDRRTVVRNPKDELKTGTYHAMLRQLGLNEQDLQE